MKDARVTMLEVIDHFCNQHPDLQSEIEKIVFKASKKSSFDANFLLALNRNLLEKSKSDLRQDIFALTALDFKCNGFFVEFGAGNGVIASNSWLLETEFNWNGILAEPAIIFHQELKNNRKAIIDTRCVWKKSHEKIIFNQASAPMLSTIDDFSGSDGHANARSDGQRYSVETVTLMDLLQEHGAPPVIDYLSIDTEGSEFDILENFNFQKYQVKVITCEHNRTASREKVKSLFEENGFVRKFENISEIDDWYIRE